MHASTSRGYVVWDGYDASPEPLRPTTPVRAYGEFLPPVAAGEMLYGFDIQEASTEQDDDESHVSHLDYGERCSMSLGWFCFIMGFVLIFPWGIGSILPICSNNRNDKWAGYWNLVATCMATAAFLSVYLSYNE